MKPITNVQQFHELILEMHNLTREEFDKIPFDEDDVDEKERDKYWKRLKDKGLGEFLLKLDYAQIRTVIEFVQNKNKGKAAKEIAKKVIEKMSTDREIA